MTGFIGPNNKLPGQTIGWIPDGRLCDSNNCNFPARHAVVSECDSFGSEIHHLCSEHFLEMQNAIKEQENQEQTCQICNTLQTNCAPFRDPSEGLAGPVYTTCLKCRQRLIAEFCGDDDDEFYPE